MQLLASSMNVSSWLIHVHGVLQYMPTRFQTHITLAVVFSFFIPAKHIGIGLTLLESTTYAIRKELHVYNGIKTKTVC